MELLTADLWQYFSRFGWHLLPVLQASSKSLHDIVWSDLTTTLVVRKLNRFPQRTAKYFAKASRASRIVLQYLFRNDPPFDLLSTVPKLTHLHIMHCNLPDRLCFLQNLRLTTLSIHAGPGRTPLSPEQLLDVTQCSGLTSLTLCPVVLADPDVVALATLTNLTHLAFEVERATDQFIPLTSLRKLVSLQWKEWWRTTINLKPPSLTWTLELPDLKELKVSIPLSPPAIWRETIHLLTRLERMELVCVFAREASELQTINDTPALKTLWIQNHWCRLLSIANPHLEDLSFDLREAGLKTLSKMTNLTNLEAFVNPETLDSTKTVQGLNSLTKLERLEITYRGDAPSTVLSPDFLAGLTLTCIQNLDLQGMIGGLSPATTHAIGNLVHLTDLNLTNCEIQDETFSQEGWPSLSNLQSLTKLSLKRNDSLLDEGISYLASQVSSLTFLDIENNPGIGDAGLLSLCQSNTNLARLHLCGTSITIQGFEVLTLLQGLTHIRDLALRDQSPDLDVLAKLPLLNSVNLAQDVNRGRTDADLSLFSQHRNLDRLILGGGIEGPGLHHIKHLPIRELGLSFCDSFKDQYLIILKEFQFLKTVFLPENQGDRELLLGLPKIRRVYKRFREPAEVCEDSPLEEWGAECGIEIFSYSE